MKLKINRRQALKTITIASAGGALGMTMPLGKINPMTGNVKSKVVLIRNNQVIDQNFKVDKNVLREMLDEAVSDLFPAAGIEQSWNKVLNKDDILGIKTNVWRYLGTPAELEQIIKEKAMGVGIDEKNISINDRSVLKDPVFSKATALINTRPMRTHAWSGLGSLLKNYIMFVPKPSDYHDDSCADLARLWYLPETKGKTRLNILVMLTPLYHGVGAHHFNPEYVWPYKGIIVSTDPVAADFVGMNIIQAKRKQHFGEDRPVNPPAKHIELADTRHHLGNASFDKIELVKKGWTDEILV